MNSSIRLLLTFVVVIFFYSSIHGQAPLKVELNIGGSYGRTIPKTTFTSGLYPEALKQQAGKILGTNVGLNILIKKIKLGLTLENRFQNWIFDSYASIKNISFSTGMNVMDRPKSSIYLIASIGYSYKRYFHAISGGQVHRSYNDSILYTTQSIYKIEDNSKINIATGIEYVWKIKPNSSLHFSIRYTRGLEPFLFMDLKSDHVQLGAGRSKAQYDGSALLFSVSYGINLLGIRHRLRDAIR